MGFASMTLFILFFVNFGFFLVAPATFNSPLLSVAKAIITSDWNIDWSSILSWDTGTKLLIMGGVTGLVMFISAALTTTASFGTNIGVTTGSQFNAVHTLLVIALAMFLFFAAVPNFSAMFPTAPQLVDFLDYIFGFIIIMSVWGIFRGE